MSIPEMPERSELDDSGIDYSCDLEKWGRDLARRLEEAERSDAESIAMYRRCRDERDDLKAKLEASEADLKTQQEAYWEIFHVSRGFASERDAIRSQADALAEALEKLSKKCPIGDYVADVYSDLSHGLIMEELDQRAEFAAKALSSYREGR